VCVDECFMCQIACQKSLLDSVKRFLCVCVRVCVGVCVCVCVRERGF